ncbi:uncharacterized protein HKW66_Vig0165580 [Vigna angularis]|uniref:Uncharacterized protein n=1 Tax=Phaseolus angularis TaxID=3914 RepID=A0A8T0JS73_PHAAN|nr:uncharacterized protein HKW66_Vig0165580 [Vigna angularis]
MEVTSSQLIASEVFPRSIVKILFYPGAAAKAICNQKTIPSYKNLLNIHQFNTRAVSAASDIQHLEVLAGSYLSVGGAITGLIKPGRMGLFGILLLMWGVIRESIMGTSGFAQAKGIHIYPAMYIVLISAFFSIRKDVRKLIRTFTRKHVVKVALTLLSAIANTGVEKFLITGLLVVTTLHEFFVLFMNDNGLQKLSSAFIAAVLNRDLTIL